MEEVFVFLIRGISYQCVNIRTSILENNNLEVHGIRVSWRGKPLNIHYLYQSPDLKGLPNELQELLTASTFYIGAKHPVWSSNSANSRCNELINIIDDKGFKILNMMEPQLIIHTAITPKNLSIFPLLALILLLLADGMFCKIEDKKKPYLTIKSSSLQPLLEERRKHIEELKANSSNVIRVKLNKINAELKRMYAQIMRAKLNELCASIDSRSSNDLNLQKFERVQLRAARIITGLHNSSPDDIMLYKADLKLLGLRRNDCLVKYYNKFCSLGSRNRTSASLKVRSNNQRLKRNGSFSQVLTTNIISGAVEQQLTQCF
ncbi:reverse transcriptase domain-containing protein [Nephila pilipes]|uniref:Reverse transcriptase domain-containing protein n=1 Tax=Nephila pilipes TaxID=299642 RepID=A0A8X6TCX7_NEPPI|nr:reverse transcriptase domain-containing protein [Nephila pilipes]